MNSNMNMGGGNPMAGPMGTGIPMMNNGAPGGVPRPMPGNDNHQRSQLNTYIYEYFLRNEMFDCARAIIQSDQPINVVKTSPGRRRDVNGNILDNGVSPEGADADSKDGPDSKWPDDLPAPNLPKECPESCFLYEWWCLFWDMFNAQRGKSEQRNIQNYIAQTQQQSRAKQEHQNQLLRQMRPALDQASYQMMLRQSQGMGVEGGLARKAMQNNRTLTPQQQMQMLQQQAQQQQQQQQQAAQQKQLQMQRDGSDLDGSRRPSSPGKAENAPSPSKRARTEGAPFGGQQNMMPNGRPQQPGQQGLIEAQFQNFQAQQQGGAAGKGPQSLHAYTSNLVQHQQNQMPNKGVPNPAGPQSQGSPMMAPGQDGSAIGAYYNTNDINGTAMRPAQGAPPGAATGNHALQDYQMQLMLLEQQNKKRLMMARQEQDNLAPRDGNGGGPGPNGQPFQGTSPQGPRSGSSPNPEMKRGTPQMNAAGIPSPLPDGQSRGSPSGMNFMPGQMMDPNIAGPQFYNKQMNGMDATMANVMQNGMRPPSSHPNGFPAQMTPQMMMARQQQAQQAASAGQAAGWQAGPNGAPMMQQQPSQNGAPQAMGTPQQRAMPPPSALPANPPANGRTQPSSPQQSAAPPTPSQANKANPKAKKDTKAKRNIKKGTNATGATPAADAAPEAATPTPATPITPVHANSFNKNGQNATNQNVPNGQIAQQATAASAAQAQPDLTQGGFSLDDNAMFSMPGLEFANPNMGTSDVLQDFDFDSFLHQDNGEDAFAFDQAFGMEGGEVGVE